MVYSIAGSPLAAADGVDSGGGYIVSAGPYPEPAFDYGERYTDAAIIADANVDPTGPKGWQWVPGCWPWSWTLQGQPHYVVSDPENMPQWYRVDTEHRVFPYTYPVRRAFSAHENEADMDVDVPNLDDEGIDSRPILSFASCPNGFLVWQASSFAGRKPTKNFVFPFTPHDARAYVARVVADLPGHAKRRGKRAK